jgi:MoaA/NifB/PqqE/SkfB family radical SAM enzyme
MYKVTSIYNHHRESIKIEWNLGKRCNYDCSYCPTIIHDNHSPHTDINILKAAVDKLPANSRISFTGGEPTVHPDFEELIQHCIKRDISWLSVTTNGTRSLQYYYKLPVHHYVFSLHFENNWQKVLSTIIDYTMSDSPPGTLKPNVINVMAYHDKMEEVREAVRRLDFYHLKYAVRRIRWTKDDHNLFDDMRYHPDDLRWILDRDATADPNTVLTYVDKVQKLHANDVIKLHLNKYKGWNCQAGIESLMINWDGDVHRATCRVGGSLGNIYTGTFAIPTEPVICTRDFCTCAADIPLTKLNVPVQEKFV